MLFKTAAMQRYFLEYMVLFPKPLPGFMRLQK